MLIKTLILKRLESFLFSSKEIDVKSEDSMSEDFYLKNV